MNHANAAAANEENEDAAFVTADDVPCCIIGECRNTSD